MTFYAPTGENLHRNNIIYDHAFLICSHQSEYVPHIFKDCHLARDAWYNVLGFKGGSLS